MPSPTLHIRLNGETRPLPAGSTLAALLAELGLAERRVAVEVNGDIIPRGRHAEHTLQDADTVEIVHALGGG
jgi:sulfur carrier protein